MLPKFAVHALVLGTSSVAASYAVPALVHPSRATVVPRRPAHGVCVTSALQTPVQT